MIRTFFDYVCNAWYPNINKKLKIRLRGAPNKFQRIKSKDFEKINWFSIHERVSRFCLCCVYKIFTKNCPNFFNEISLPLEINGVHTHSSYQKLIVPHRKTNAGQKALSYTGPSL